MCLSHWGRDVLDAIAALAGLAQVGKVTRRGVPTNPLQLAATLQIMVKHGT